MADSNLNTHSLTAVDIFGGGGISERILRDLGVNVIYSMDNKVKAIKIRNANNPGTEEPKDFYESADEIPVADIGLFTPSCKSLSGAGVSKLNSLGKPINVEEGAASHIMIDALYKAIEIGFKAIVIENVARLITGEKGKILKICVKILESGGYTAYHKVINYEDCGGLSMRKRGFIVAFKGDNEFTWPTNEEIRDNYHYQKYETIGDAMTISVKKENFIPITTTKKRAPSIKGWLKKEWRAKVGLSLKDELAGKKPDPKKKKSFKISDKTVNDKLMYCILANHYKNPSQGAIRIPVEQLPDYMPDATQAELDEIIEEFGYEGHIWNKTSSDEYKRLLGYPEDYKLGAVSETSAIEMLGNSLPVPVMRGILTHVVRELST
jgi:site-specific DNA-cytosine methylase